MLENKDIIWYTGYLFIATHFLNLDILSITETWLLQTIF